MVKTNNIIRYVAKEKTEKDLQIIQKMTDSFEIKVIKPPLL